MEGAGRTEMWGSPGRTHPQGSSEPKAGGRYEAVTPGNIGFIRFTVSLKLPGCGIPDFLWEDPRRLRTFPHLHRGPFPGLAGGRILLREESRGAGWPLTAWKGLAMHGSGPFIGDGWRTARLGEESEQNHGNNSEDYGAGALTVN